MYTSLKKESDKMKKYLIIGPGASGKSTLATNLSDVPTKYKPKFGKDYTFENNNILFLAPTYGMSRGSYNINIDSWVKILSGEKIIALFCYVPWAIQIKRLVKRLKERRLKDVVSNNVIDEAVNVLIDKNVNVDDELNELGNKYGNHVKNNLMKFFCKDMFFSYDELYEKLNKNNIEFYIINTFSEEERG